MAGFLARRLLNYGVLLFLASSSTYVLAASTLDPRANFLGRHPAPPPAAVDATLDELNLNDETPLPQRYASWAVGLLHGDFGRTVLGGSVNAEMGRRVGVSLRLLIIGTLLGSIFGVLVGAAAAVRQYRWFDRTTTLLSFLVFSIPVFLLGLLLQIGAVHLNDAIGVRAIQFTGEYTPGLTGGPWTLLVDRVSHLLLPSLSIALGLIAIYSRYQRSTLLDVLGSDFVRAARARGLRRGQATYRHALRVALIPLAAFFAYGFGLLVTGAVVTENVFGWHGMGEWFVQSVNTNDVNAVAAVGVLTAFLVLVAGLLSDVMYAVLDPRVRSGR